LGYEVDGCWNGTPCKDFQTDCPNWAGGTIKLAESTFTVTENPTCTTGRAYMTIYTAASGAQVFATGSMNWSWGLDGFPVNVLSGWTSKANSDAQQLTHNVLRTFTGQSRGLIIP
jgi:hypothetical protein